MYALFLLGLLQVSSTIFVEDTDLPWSKNIDHLEEEGVLVIKGTNTNSLPQLIVIRMDDNSSSDYYSRTNLERKVASGPFELRLSVLGLMKENKTRLNIDDLRKIFVFNATDKKSVDRKSIEIVSIGLEENRALPEFIHAYDFGSYRSAVLEGTSQVSLPINNKSYQEIKLLGQMKEIERPGPDPWIRDGISGIEEIRIPLSKGLWRLSLFREDIGEWENLPRQLNLNIALNGVERVVNYTVEKEQQAARWYQKEYLKFYNSFADKDPWQEIISQRGLVQNFDFEQTTDELTIRLLGDSPQQRFVSGLILQKLDHEIHTKSGNGLNLVNKRREDYFRQHWLVENSDIKHIGKSKLRLAQGEGRLIEFDTVLEQDVNLHLDSTFQQYGGYVEVRQVIPRWRRQGSEQHLKKQFTHLTAVNQGEVIQGERKLALWLKADILQTAGHYDVMLSLKTSDNKEVKSFVVNVEVIDQKLPINTQKVGIYLDHSPHLGFFKEWETFKLAQVYCDLNYLDRLGLRALAPPLATPTENNLSSWQKELDLYSNFYGKENLLAYTPYKRLKHSLSQGTLKKKMSGLTRDRQNEVTLYWSIADEILQSQFEDVEQDAALLHSANQFAKTAGHLNDKKQQVLIDELDLILMNHGYGINIEEIRSIHNTLSTNENDYKHVWLYNMPNFRLAAGAFLWHSKADAYVQWHGRMPTANPYDPTDGREGDYQLFYPQPTACEALPDIDRGLFELAMGQYELRWYLWLDEQTDIRANELKREITTTLGSDWSKASLVDDLLLDVWRDQIINLAQSLKQPNKSKELLGDDDENTNLFSNQQAYRISDGIDEPCDANGVLINYAKGC